MTKINRQWEEDRSRIAEYYDQLVSKYGDSPRSCDYGTAESQKVKFKVLSEQLPEQGFSILEVGCGLGHFNLYLASCKSNYSYLGIDISENMIAAARDLQPDANFQKLDILSDSPPGRHDFVVANGIFYLLKEEPWSTTETLLRVMYSLADKAVFCTSLSSKAPFNEEGEFQIDPGKLINFCFELSPYLTLRHDYFVHDFTLGLFKEPNR